MRPTSLPFSFFPYLPVSLSLSFPRVPVRPVFPNANKLKLFSFSRSHVRNVSPLQCRSFPGPVPISCPWSSGRPLLFFARVPYFAWIFSGPFHFHFLCPRPPTPPPPPTPPTPPSPPPSPRFRPFLPRIFRLCAMPLAGRGLASKISPWATCILR